MFIQKTKIYKLAQRFRLLSESIAWYESFYRDAELRRWVLESIKDRLRNEGTDSNNDVIGYYSFQTSRINPKKRFNTHYTLEDTGEMFRSMYIDVALDYISINVDSRKIEDRQWYSEQIFNLTDEQLIELKYKLKDKFIKYAKKIIFQG